MAERFHTVVPQGQPQFESTEPARQFDRFLKKREAFNRVVAQNTGVVAGVRESFARSVTIPIKQTTAVQWLVQPLVWIEGDRIRQFQALEPVARGQCGQSAVGAVHMEPDAMFSCDGRNLCQRIDRARVYRASGGYNRDRSFTGFLVTRERPIELRGNHVKRLIGPNQPQVLSSDSQQSHSLWNRHVYFFRSIDGALW